MTKARKVPAVLLAFIVGFAVEAALGVISVVSVLAGGIGPCGFTGDAPGFVRVIHQPGFWLAGALVGDSSLNYFLLAILITTVFLSILAFFVLRWAGRTNEILLSNASSDSLKIVGDSVSDSSGDGSTRDF